MSASEQVLLPLHHSPHFAFVQAVPVMGQRMAYCLFSVPLLVGLIPQGLRLASPSSSAQEVAQLQVRSAWRGH
jgi:hypothetical protein